MKPGITYTVASPKGLHLNRTVDTQVSRDSSEGPKEERKQIAQHIVYPIFALMY